MMRLTVRDSDHFQFKRHVRQRLSVPPIDLARPHAGVANPPRTKRKTRLSYRHLDMLSCSSSGAEPPTNVTILDGSADSATDSPMDFSSQSTRRVRRRLATNPSDLPQPNSKSSQQLWEERDPSTLQTSCRLNEPSCSGVGGDKDGPLCSSSNGHRRELFSNMPFSTFSTKSSIS